MPFVKLSALDTFELKFLKDQSYKKWDDVQKRMDVSDNWFQGSHKVYTVETDQGTLDLTEDQLSKILVAAFNPAAMTSSIQGKRYKVRTNGKTGIEIRYFFGLVIETQNLPPSSAPSQENDKTPRDRAMDAMEAQKLANMVGGTVEPDWSAKQELKIEEIPF